MPEDNASWYARKLGQQRTPQGFQRQPLPQYQPPPVQGYQQQLPQVEQQPDSSATPGTLSELLDLQAHGAGPKQGKGAKLNPDPCPACGGNLYYADLGMKRRGPPPAPRCFNCGYNELFEQGLESNWQAGA